MSKINILCLHGCNQTKDMFGSILKAFMELASTYEKNKSIKFNWHFVEAKYDHPFGGKTWYNKPLDVAQIGSIEMDNMLVADALADLDKTINDLDIHVLFGFSQGGNVVDTYLTNIPTNKIKCAAIFSGYDLINKARMPVPIPVINVCSDIDEIVPSKFMPIYPNMTIKKHDKGHKIPTSRPLQREILDFIATSCS
jgi:predicted esterase